MNAKTHADPVKRLARILAILAAICLMPLAPIPVFAQEKEVTNLFGSELVDRQDSILSTALVGDTLYILTQNALYTWTGQDMRAQRRVDFDPAQRTLRLQEDMDKKPPVWDLLFTDGERLLGLDGLRQTVYALELSGDNLTYQKVIKLDLSEFISGDPPFSMFQTPEWAKVVDGRLYIKQLNWDNLPLDLYSFYLKTGEKTGHKATNIIALTPYKDGDFIAVTLDQSQRYDEQTGEQIPPQAALYNPEKESLTPLEISIPLPISGTGRLHVYYDQAEDALFSYTDTDIYRFDGDMKEKKLIGYLPMFSNFSVTGAGIIALPDGRLAIPFAQNIFLREKTEKGLEGYAVLRMSGSLDDTQALMRVLMEMDKVVFRSVENTNYNRITQEQLATMFLTRDVSVDLMLIDTNGFDIDKLIMKGYLADLSASVKITNYLNALAPNLKKTVYDGQKPHVLPISITAFPISANINNLKEVGAAIPTTLQEYVELCIRWATEMAEEHPEYMFITNSTNLNYTLMTQLIERYTANLLGEGKELQFDTPLFRGLMQKVMDADYGDLGREVDWEEADDEAMMELWEKSPLFESGMGFDPQNAVGGMRNSDNNKQQYLYLPQEEGGEGQVEANMQLMVVLKTSENKDAAITFLEHYLDKMNALSRAALTPDMTQAIPNPNYEKELKDSESALTRYQEQMDKLTGAEKSNVEENFKYMKSHHERLKTSGQYWATEEEMKALHETISHFFLFSGLGNTQRRTYWDSYELVDQMIDGVISLEQFVKQMDDKLRLVRMEYQ